MDTLNILMSLLPDRPYGSLPPDGCAFVGSIELTKSICCGIRWGQVYEGHISNEPNRIIALKLIDPMNFPAAEKRSEESLESRAEQQITREMSAYERLQGLETVPKWYGTYYFSILGRSVVGHVLEYVQGGHFSPDYFGDAMEYEPVGALLLKATRMLDEIHSRGVIHGDVRAENLLAPSFGRIIFLDFGSAVIFDKAEYDTHVLNTLPYQTRLTDFYQLSRLLIRTGGIPDSAYVAWLRGLPAPKIKVVRDLMNSWGLADTREEALAGDWASLGRFDRADVCRTRYMNRPARIPFSREGLKGIQMKMEAARLAGMKGKMEGSTSTD